MRGGPPTAGARSAPFLTRAVAPAAVALAGIYVSIPYTLSQSSAITLGLAQAIIVIYLSLGRGGFGFM